MPGRFGLGAALIAVALAVLALLILIPTGLLGVCYLAIRSLLIRAKAGVRSLMGRSDREGRRNVQVLNRRQE